MIHDINYTDVDNAMKELGKVKPETLTKLARLKDWTDLNTIVVESKDDN